MHKISLPAWALEPGRQRGSFSTIDPARTALIVVDLQNAFMVPGQVLANQHACDIVPNVNTIARALRARGGAVVFLRHTVSDEPRFKLTEWEARMVPRTPEGDLMFRDGTYPHRLYEALEALPQDLKVNKHRFSAFMPNSSDLDRELRARGIETLIITGTVTNVCCECTARDGNMLGYKILFVSDATAALTDDEHNATLLSMTTVFGEVRPTSSVVDLIDSGAVQAKRTGTAR